MVIAILTPASPHLSVLYSCCISATTAFFFVFLNVELDSGQVNNIYEASEIQSVPECFLRLKQNKEKVNVQAHYSKSR